MYIILLVYSTSHYRTPITKIFNFEDLELAHKELPKLKDRFSSVGCRISELKIFKTEQIQNPYQI